MTEASERLALHVGEAYGQMGVWVMDPTVSDAERARAGLPTLADTYAAVLEENLRRVAEAASRKTLLPGAQCERVAREYSPDELDRRLQGNRVAVWAEDDQLTVALRTESAFGYVASGFEMPLWPTAGSNVRTATVRIRDLSRATLWLRITESTEVGNVFANETVVCTLPWRGPNAPPPPEQVEVDQQLVDVPSAALGAPRSVLVSMPDRAPEVVIFGTDGMTAAPVIRSLERRGVVPPVALFGVMPAMASGGDFLARLDEYYYGRAPEVFDPHFRFFTEELPAWIKSNYGVSAPRDRTVVIGGSAGGRFAAELPVLEPEQFGMSIALSSHMELEPQWSNASPVYGVGTGTLEDPNGTRRKLAERLRRAGARVHLYEWVGGHDGMAWVEAIAALLPEVLAAR